MSPRSYGKHDMLKDSHVVDEIPPLEHSQYTFEATLINELDVNFD